eukprot:s768_g6.t1
MPGFRIVDGLQESWMHIESRRLSARTYKMLARCCILALFEWTSQEHVNVGACRARIRPACLNSTREGMEGSMSMQSLSAPKEDSQDDGESIRVHIRVRPPTEREIAVGSAQAVFVDGSSVIIKSDPPRSFAFDGVLGESSTQQDVFESLGRMVGSSCLAGYNGSVYVYGQTGAGKTHTMCGPITSVQSMQFDERRGIICRMLDYVFSEVARRGTEDSGVEHSCRCSFLEIYKEQITDLLEPANTNLQVREDMNRGVYVERLSEVTVGSLTEAFQALWRGLQQRQVGSTHMNERSSRSHAVFTLYVEAGDRICDVPSELLWHPAGWTPQPPRTTLGTADRTKMQRSLNASRSHSETSTSSSNIQKQVLAGRGKRSGDSQRGSERRFSVESKAHSRREDSGFLCARAKCFVSWLFESRGPTVIVDSAA